MFDLNDIIDFEFTTLPVYGFCVRKPAAVFAENRYWIYADVIPWDNPYWPDTYDTSIHAFSSPDCREWEYHGEVVGHKEVGAWDYGGVVQVPLNI